MVLGDAVRLQRIERICEPKLISSFESSSFLLTARLAEIEGKAHLSLIISENLLKDKNLNASNIMREISKEIQGGEEDNLFMLQQGVKIQAALWLLWKS